MRPLWRSLISLCYLIALVIPNLAEVSAETQFMPVDQVKAGMVGVGKSVFSGTEIEEFQVEILGLKGKENHIGPSAKTELVSGVKKKRYGERTVGMMIQRALLNAGLLKKSGASKSTKYIEALVENKVKGTRKGMVWVIVAVIALLVVGGGGIGIYVYLNRSVQVYQTTQVNYGDATGSAIAAANRYTVFLLAGRARETGQVQGFCTGFAISENVLATNAHCVTTAKRAYTDVILLMNGAPKNQRTIERMVSHPGYRDGRISPDVGLLQVNGTLPHVVQIAPQAELAQIAPGVSMFLYGFPGRLNRIDAPEATFIKGEIGRVTAFDQKLGEFGNNALLQHSAFSSSGTSGSPMFNGQGRVIGINAGGYMEDGQILSGYNFGVRIDLIYSLLAELQKR